MTDHRNPPATAIEAVGALSGDITGPEAEAILASYFAPGPQLRYDTPQARAEAEAEPEASL